MQWCSSYNPDYLGKTIVSMGNLWCTPGTYTFKGKPAITKDNITTNLIDSVQIRHCSDNEDAVFLCGKRHLFFGPAQISFASALSSLSDRSRFKSYFRTTSSFNTYAPAILALLNRFNWKRVAFITQNENLFLTVSF